MGSATIAQHNDTAVIHTFHRDCWNALVRTHANQIDRELYVIGHGLDPLGKCSSVNCFH